MAVDKSSSTRGTIPVRPVVRSFCKMLTASAHMAASLCCAVTWCLPPLVWVDFTLELRVFCSIMCLACQCFVSFTDLICFTGYDPVASNTRARGKGSAWHGLALPPHLERYLFSLTLLCVCDLKLINSADHLVVA
jgi:hypothetical protein